MLPQVAHGVQADDVNATMKEAIRVSNVCRLGMMVCVRGVVGLARRSNGGASTPASQDSVQMEGHCSVNIEERK